jgi:hypothetical protein
MKISNLIVGLQILSKYYRNKEQIFSAAKDNEIEVSPTDDPLSDDDLKYLYKLGFHQKQQWADAWHRGIDPRPYDPTDSWIIIV